MHACTGVEVNANIVHAHFYTHIQNDYYLPVHAHEYNFLGTVANSLGVEIFT